MANPESVGAESIDNSSSAMMQRLLALQPALGYLLLNAIDLFDIVAPNVLTQTELASSPDRDKRVPYLAVAVDETRCIPKVGDLCLPLKDKEIISISRAAEFRSDRVPVRLLRHYQPSTDGQTLQTKVSEMKRTKLVYNATPFDISVSDYNSDGRHIGFVGDPYFEKEQYIDQANLAVEEARRMYT